MVFEELSLKGKVALVTGGGSGIGSGILQGLAEAGASIVCVYNRHAPEAMERYVTEIGGEFLAIQADVSQIELLPKLLRRLWSALGGWIFW